MNTRGIAALAVGLLLIAGCGTGAGAAEPDRPPDLTMLEVSGHWDYEVADSPEELLELRDHDVVVVGTVEEIADGRGIVRYEGSEPDPQLVMPVEVTETLEGDDSGLIHDGHVYVEIPQGGVNAEGDPAFPVSQWRQAIPAGTRVMLFLADFDFAKENDKSTVNEDRGLPEGATRLVADPQGIIFEYDGNIAQDADGENPIATWDVQSIDEISERVKKHLAGGSGAR